jgi:hypothetical protein
MQVRRVGVQVAEQRLHSALAPIDILTRIEMEQVLHKGLSTAVWERFLGIESQRIPTVETPGNGGTLSIGSINSGDPTLGPEQGDVWMIRRVNVVSSAFTTDTARYILFRGSTPSDIQQGYTNRQLLDAQAFIPAISGGTTMATPAGGNPVSGTYYQNTTNQVYTVVISNGGGITTVVVNGVTVGTGAGTYIVPVGGAIQVNWTTTQPTWVWSATQQGNQSFTLGQQVGIAYNPGNKAVLLHPGEQLYAQVYNTNAGNTYLLSGEAIRVPAEMKGKVL